MIFEPGHLYHIYNQGNNQQKIFFSHDNYLFFVKKIEHHILPYADILAWCLMPNHFHLMVYINNPVSKARTLNDSIGIMLRSYTRAINNQEQRSGSLFRGGTKSICLSQPEINHTPWYFANGATVFWSGLSEKQYPNTCFNYILNNPVKAGLVKKASQWKFSSFNELTAEKGLINKKRIEEFGLKILSG